MASRTPVALVIAATLAAACGDCITLACFDGLTVKLPTSITSPYRVELESPDAGNRTFDCAAPFECMPVFTNYRPSRVTVRVIQGADTVVTPNIVPEYQTTHGGCGNMTCHSAVVTVNTPQ